VFAVVLGQKQVRALPLDFLFAVAVNGFRGPIERLHISDFVDGYDAV
jgi:hypothetical protein